MLVVAIFLNSSKRDTRRGAREKVSTKIPTILSVTMRQSDGVVSTKYSCSVPQVLGSIDKPIRKRSKASKKTPTTLLNANTTNFRALVQQFTGRRSAGSYKGPITLNFAVPTQHNDFNETSTSTTTSLHCYNYYTQKTSEQHQNYQHQLEDEKFHEDQAGFFSYDTNVVSHDDAFVSTSSNPTPEELNSDDFDIDNILFRDLPGAGTMIDDDFWGC